MKPLRRRITVAAAAACAAVSVAWTVHAQSTSTGPAAMPQMDHMTHDHGQAVPDRQPMMSPQGGEQHMSPEHSDDPREFVHLPGPMQEHMLGNMRDHLATLNTVIGDIADGKFDAASKLLEARLGMSSLQLHHAAEMAPYFPQPMQDAGTNMHHAASRLAIALEDASITQTFDSMRKVDGALHEVTSSCVACHTSYRVR